MQEKLKHKNPYYPDIPIFLVLIPIINSINYYLTYSNIQLNSFLVLTFSIDTVQGYLAWLGIRQLILYFDEKLPYQRAPLKRIIIQLISTLVLGLLIISGATELVSWIAKGESAPIHFYTRDLFIISIWFFVINGFYIGLHYYREWQTLEDLRHKENRLKSRGFIVKHGDKNLKIGFEDLFGFYVDGSYIVACSTKGKRYYLDQSQSLNKVEEVLPGKFFFRLNRQFILHRQMVSGFKRAENGKINVLVENTRHFPPEISVSRTKAPLFKSWLQQE